MAAGILAFQHHVAEAPDSGRHLCHRDVPVEDHLAAGGDVRVPAGAGVRSHDNGARRLPRRAVLRTSMVVRILRDGQGVRGDFLERGAASPAEALPKEESAVMGSGAARPGKVLYAEALGRSGSTILASSLGHVEGFLSGGVSNFIWKHVKIENRLCGCGK